MVFKPSKYVFLFQVTSCLRKADVCVGLVKKTLSWMVSEQWILGKQISFEETEPF